MPGDPGRYFRQMEYEALPGEIPLRRLFRCSPTFQVCSKLWGKRVRNSLKFRGLFCVFSVRKAQLILPRPGERFLRGGGKSMGLQRTTLVEGLGIEHRCCLVSQATGER